MRINEHVSAHAHRMSQDAAEHDDDDALPQPHHRAPHKLIIIIGYRLIEPLRSTAVREDIVHN